MRCLELLRAILRSHASIFLFFLAIASYEVFSQQRLFDTEFAKSGEADLGDITLFTDTDPHEKVSLNKSLQEFLSDNASLFSRERRSFEIGLNWGAIHSKELRKLLKVSVDDLRLDDDKPAASAKLNRNPQNSRMIVVDDSWLWKEGFSMMTRVDPELAFDGSTQRPILSIDNSAALHAFESPGSGVVEGGYVKLRTTQGGSEYTGNTNARVWDPYYNAGTISYKENGTVYHDPTRSGDFMVVGVCLRRVGAIDPTLADDDVILKIRVLAQERLWINPSTSTYENEPESRRWLRFSFIPKTPQDPSPPNSARPWLTGVEEPKEIATDVLAKLFPSIDSKFSIYPTMPLNGAVSTQSALSPRELVWQHQSDVRDVGANTTGTPTSSEEIRITAGMLRELIDHATTPGGSGDYDGESFWTIFEGLIVFAPGGGDDASDDIRLHEFDNDTKQGLASIDINPVFKARHPSGKTFGEIAQSGPNGGHLTVSEGVVNRLKLELEYTGLADVDVDYVAFQTPNARALLRDQYRTTVAEAVARSVSKFDAVAASGSGYKILGLRSMEEKGEAYWYAQRYLNILTNGLAISEITYRPFDRYRQCAYPLSNPNGLAYPDGPLPLWLWNESCIGRNEPATPVPYLSVASGKLENPLYFGVREGLCGFGGGGYGYMMYEPGAPDHSSLVGVDRALMLRMATDDYDFGKAPRNSPGNIHHASVAPDPGEQSGEFSFHKSVSLDFWENPWLYEDVDFSMAAVGNYYGYYSIDTDGSTLNDYPVQLEYHSFKPYGHSESKWDAVREVNQLLSMKLYREFQSPGNTGFLFSGDPWYEQVWMSTQIELLRAEAVGGGWHTFLTNLGNQARSHTAEEVRIRFMLPTLLGASGLMVFVGGGGSVHETVDLTNEPPDPEFTTSRRWLFNLQSWEDAENGDVATTISHHAYGEAYGADYPQLGTSVNLATKYPDPDSPLDLYEGDYELPMMSYYKNTNGHNYKPIVIHDYGVKDALGIERKGYEVVQRVDPDGAINNSVASEEKVYWGSYSARQEWLRYSDWMKSELSSEDYTVAGADLPATVADLLGMLDLYGWHSRSFKEFTLWKDQDTEPNPLSEWLDLSRLGVRHPYREFNGRADYERQDSNFVDITLLKRRLSLSDTPYESDKYVNDEVYIGVSNRRQNPLYMQDVSDPGSIIDDQPKFSSAQEFFALVSNSVNNRRLYDQLGSRSVVIPFDYQPSPDEPKLLHVQEVYGSDPEENRADDEVVYYEHNDGTVTRSVKRVAIDTVIDAKATLEVNLLPGEGLLLRVKPVEAAKNVAIGNLAFSGQSKLVASPEQTYDNSSSPIVITQENDKIVYHMAYTRADGQYLRVFYRQSVPYERDNLPEVAGLEWMPEVMLGNSFVVRKPQPGVAGTLWQTSATRPFDACYANPIPPGSTHVDIDVTHDVINEDAQLRVYVESAFPSIAVARELALDSQGNETAQYRVHIVYSSTVFKKYFGIEPGAPDWVGEQHIVESTFRAGATNTAADLTSRSLAVIATQDDAAFNDSFLKSWGTPSNGVSTSGIPNPPVLPRDQSDRIFTAWSTRPGFGITSGVRATWGDNVPLNGGYQTGPVNGLASDADQLALTQSVGIAQQTALAQYPSLTPTNTSVGNSTPAASLVWQEQAFQDASNADLFDGYAVMYTRVWEDDALNPAYGNHDYGFTQDRSVIPFVSTPVPDMDIFPSIGGVLNGNVYHNYVMRVSKDANTNTSIYPTIARSGLPIGADPVAPMTITITDNFVSENFNFQFETITWQTHSPSLQPNTFIARRHFIHNDASVFTGPGDGLRFWGSGSTYSLTQNFVAPTVANGHHRTGYQEQPLDPILGDDVLLAGNISDTAVVSSFGVITGDLSTLNPPGSLDWETWNAPNTVWQVHLRYVPIPPHIGAIAPYGDGYQNDDRKSLSTGIWPHLGHQSFGISQSKQNVRRVQQESATHTTSKILVSAEGFYKRDSGPTWRTKHGYSSGDEELTLGGFFRSGIELEFRPATDQGANPIEAMYHAMTDPLPPLVSQTFTAPEVREVLLDFDGLLRENVKLYIEEVDGYGVPIPQRSVALGLPERPNNNDVVKRRYAMFSLVGGGEAKRYRFRAEVTAPYVPHEDDLFEIIPSGFAKSKSEEQSAHVVDLSIMAVSGWVETASLSLYPNPSSGHVTILPVQGGNSRDRLRIQIHDITGGKVLEIDAQSSTPITLDLARFQAGTYTVTMLSSVGFEARTQLVVLR